MRSLRSLFAGEAQKHELAPWDRVYLDHLKAELNALDKPADDPAILRARAVIAKFESEPNKGTRGDLLELELTLLALQPTSMLVQRAPVLRFRYQEIVGDRQFATYKPSAPCGPGKEDDPSFRRALLSDLLTVVSSLHWRYVMSPLRGQLQTQLTKKVLRRILGYAAVWLLALAVFHFWYQHPFLVVLSTVIFAGAIGGLISALRRLQSIGGDGDSLWIIQALKDGQYFLWLSPLLGSTFAVVLMLVFISNLVGGQLFPAFPLPKDAIAHGKWEGFVLPSASVDYGKLFVWCFIAGFAEQFVPDLLDKLVRRSQSINEKPIVNSPTMTPVSNEAQVGSDKNDGTSRQPATPKPVAPPSLSMEPTEGAIKAPVTITGQDFGTSQGTVKFNGITAPITTWADKKIEVTVPDEAQTGDLVVVVRGVETRVGTFTVTK